MFLQGKTAPLPETHTARMKHRIDSPDGRMRYGQRFGTVEPVFGNLCYNKGTHPVHAAWSNQGRWAVEALLPGPQHRKAGPFRLCPVDERRQPVARTIAVEHNASSVHSDPRRRASRQNHASPSIWHEMGFFYNLNERCNWTSELRMAHGSAVRFYLIRSLAELGR